MLLRETGDELVNVCDQLERTSLHYAALADDVKVRSVVINLRAGLCIRSKHKHNHKDIYT